MAKRLPEAELNEFISNVSVPRFRETHVCCFGCYLRFCVCLGVQLIHMLELDHVADWLVGSEETGIPRGERKRYTIGVELVTNPSVLFLGKCASAVLCVCVRQCCPVRVFARACGVVWVWCGGVCDCVRTSM